MLVQTLILSWGPHQVGDASVEGCISILFGHMLHKRSKQIPLRKNVKGLHSSCLPLLVTSFLSGRNLQAFEPSTEDVTCYAREMKTANISNLKETRQ